MILVNRKRFTLVISAIFIALIVGTLQNTQVNTIETVSLPVSNKVIVIDAGHGIPDEGAESSNRNY